MSRGLGQGELLVPEPTRRLSVREGCTAWWGIDPSTVRVSIATVDVEGCRGVSTAPFGGEPGPRRLAAVLSGTRALAQEMAAVCAPGVVVIEQPSGKTPNPNLVYAVGVIVAVVADVVRPSHVEMVTSSGWKAVACGKGNIYKPQKEKGKPAPASEDYAVLQWARAAGYRGSSWDEADAWGVADYAWRTFALAER